MRTLTTKLVAAMIAVAVSTLSLEATAAPMVGNGVRTQSDVVDVRHRRHHYDDEDRGWSRHERRKWRRHHNRGRYWDDGYSYRERHHHRRHRDRVQFYYDY